MPFEGVSLASPADEDDLYQHLLLLHKENGLYTVSERKVRETIRVATEQRGGVIGVIRGDDGLEGSIGMMLDQWWYTEDFCLGERWVFVHKDHRRKPHASRLIDFGKWAASQMGVSLQIGIMSTKQTEAKMRMYQRKLTQIGGFFMHPDPRQASTAGADMREVASV
jgi:hypothetical protein